MASHIHLRAFTLIFMLSHTDIAIPTSPYSVTYTNVWTQSLSHPCSVTCKIAHPCQVTQMYTPHSHNHIQSSTHSHSHTYAQLNIYIIIPKLSHIRAHLLIPTPMLSHIHIPMLTLASSNMHVHTIHSHTHTYNTWIPILTFMCSHIQFTHSFSHPILSHINTY